MNEAKFEILRSLSPDLQFNDTEGSPIKVSEISLDDSGKIVSVTTYDGNILGRDEIEFNKEVLNIPGVGQVPPGSLVYYKGEPYLINFGWHTNYSNQQIYSWYLEYIGNNDCDSKIKTIYFNDIKYITSAQSYCYESEFENYPHEENSENASESCKCHKILCEG